MAGIGFELRKMIESGPGLVSKMRAYACAGLISSGPWVMTMVGVWLITVTRGGMSVQEDFDNFRALVTYAFAFSLLTVGTLQMAVTRHVADGLYRREYGKVLPAFVATLGCVAALQVVVGVCFCFASGFAVPMTFVFVSLYVVISLTWVTLIWLSVIRQFDRIFVAYVAGIALSWIMMRFTTRALSVETALGAYTMGQALTLVLLVRLIVRGTEAAGERSFDVFRCVTRYPQLMLVGLFYSAAIWVDKMVFWFVGGMGFHPTIRFHPLYDTCCFLAYVTVLPALAINLIHLETRFYERYRGYYDAVLHGLPLKVLEQRRNDMVENLREGAIRLIRTQGAITCMFIVLAPTIVEELALPDAAIRTFRLTCLGALFHVLLLITTLILLYFDLRKQAVISCLTFLVLNAGGAFLCLEIGVESYGLGYAVAALVALVLAFSFLTRGLNELDYQTFTTPARIVEP